VIDKKLAPGQYLYCSFYTGAPKKVPVFLTFVGI